MIIQQNFIEANILRTQLKDEYNRNFAIKQVAIYSDNFELLETVNENLKTIRIAAAELNIFLVLNKDNLLYGETLN